MPMERELYPANWEEISVAKRASAQWACEECGRPCRITIGSNAQDPENWDVFEQRLSQHPNWEIWLPSFYGFDEGTVGTDLDEEDYLSATRKPNRFTLTVAHIDQDPSNCEPSNLKALCSVCHIRFDKRPENVARRRFFKAAREGEVQLGLNLNRVSTDQ